MKRWFVVLGLIVFIFTVSLFGAETPKEGENSEDTNIKKAGEELLGKLDAKLQSIKKNIEAYIQEEVPKDGRISAKEIKTLKKKIKELDREKEKADNSLDIYKLKTETDIGKEIFLKDILVTYTTKDRGGMVRKTLAGLTGKNLPVDKRVKWWWVGIGTFLIIAGIGSFKASYSRSRREDADPESVPALFLLGVATSISGLGCLIGVGFFW